MRESPERKSAERRVRVRCDTWHSFVDLYTRNLSRGGLFLRTDHAATAGSAVTVDLCLPDGRTLKLHGEVVQVISVEEAAPGGRPAGMGVRFTHPDDEGSHQLETTFREAKQAIAARPPTPRPPPAETPSGDADFEDPDLLDALLGYVETLRGRDAVHAIGLEPGADIAEIDIRLETLAERFAPEWYTDRSPEVRAAAAEVALALRDVHHRVHMGEHPAPSGEGDEVEGLDEGRLFGDLEFLEKQAGLQGDVSSPVSVADRAPIEWLRTGVALLHGHRYREACEMLKRALDANPSDTECRRDYHLALGHDLRESGRLDEAARAYEQALRADPRCTEAAAAVQAIGDTRGGGGKKGAILGRLLRK